MSDLTEKHSLLLPKLINKLNLQWSLQIDFAQLVITVHRNAIPPHRDLFPWQSMMKSQLHRSATRKCRVLITEDQALENIDTLFEWDGERD